MNVSKYSVLGLFNTAASKQKYITKHALLPTYYFKFTKLFVDQRNIVHDNRDHDATRNTDMEGYLKAIPIYPLVAFARIYPIGNYIV